MTIHETIIVRPLVRWLALMFFKLTGWTTEGHQPDLRRYVIIAAPHTSNWDFVYTLCLAFIYRFNPVIMMKDTWFRWPLGPVFRWLGVMPIDRARTNNVVSQSISRFSRCDRLALVVPPSGTRKRVLYWKTGFYHIANGAGVTHCARFPGLPAQGRRIRAHCATDRRHRCRHGRDPQFLP
jgi:1-acyl-sn-glycerol-3-phosphate acyltransferase